jgi:hypothetical protein
MIALHASVCLCDFTARGALGRVNACATHDAEAAHASYSPASCLAVFIPHEWRLQEAECWWLGTLRGEAGGAMIRRPVVLRGAGAP